MHQGRFKLTDQEGSTGQQGKFGENNTSNIVETWMCPNCETINTEETCVLCGYKKVISPVKKVQGKRIVIILATILVLVSGLLLAIPNGWKEKDGNYYYYIWGRKSTGKAEIDGVEYYFSEKGIAQVVKRDIATTRSGGNITFTLEDGRKTWGNYRILNNPAEQCTYLHVRVDVTRLDQGDSDGNWQLSVRDKSTQKAWIHIADFEVRKGKGDCFVTLEEPISFEAFTCTRTEKGDWSGEINQEIIEMRYLK